MNTTEHTYRPGDRVHVPAGAVLAHTEGGPTPHPYAGREGTVTEVRALGSWPISVQLDGDLAGPLSLAYAEVEPITEAEASPRVVPGDAPGRAYGEGYDGRPLDDRTEAEKRDAADRAEADDVEGDQR